MNATKLTPLGRLVAVVLVLMAGAIAGAAGATATRPHAQEWRCVAVRPGDTLWSIASAGSGDRREVVEKIVEHNRLSGGGLSSGDAIWVPTGIAGAGQGVSSELCRAGLGAD